MSKYCIQVLDHDRNPNPNFDAEMIENAAYPRTYQELRQSIERLPTPPTHDDKSHCWYRVRVEYKINGINYTRLHALAEGIVNPQGELIKHPGKYAAKLKKTWFPMEINVGGVTRDGYGKPINE